MGVYPIPLFDSDCAFRTASGNVLSRCTRPSARITAWQHADLDTRSINEQECGASLQWLAVPRPSPITPGRAVAAARRRGVAIRGGGQCGVG